MAAQQHPMAARSLAHGKLLQQEVRIMSPSRKTLSLKITLEKEAHAGDSIMVILPEEPEAVINHHLPRAKNQGKPS